MGNTNWTKISYPKYQKTASFVLKCNQKKLIFLVDSWKTSYYAYQSKQILLRVFHTGNVKVPSLIVYIFQNRGVLCNYQVREAGVTICGRLLVVVGLLLVVCSRLLVIFGFLLVVWDYLMVVCGCLLMLCVRLLVVSSRLWSLPVLVVT